ncbi:hypothetical protein PR202_gb11886 [Eleusine coracana subsp. coracana]|uniref:Secretory carrier-associated membrane protein n=1 Tax=Eleusine coracana subsp. coracana TaxID=191504 RepID=A0AAV5ENY3_ELECO|nr:hypothetical protein PR202_gb11886 [Eleusine coracana subsp. coracana]
MAGRWRQDDNPFAEGEGDVNPFSHARPTPLPPEPAGFYNDIDASVDIPLGTKKFHIAFCIYAAAAPSFFWSGRSLTGIFQAIYQISDSNAAVGIMYFVGFALFVLEALLSIWVMQKVYWFFRGKGNEAVMRSDAAGAPPF